MSKRKHVATKPPRRRHRRSSTPQPRTIAHATVVYATYAWRRLHGGNVIAQVSRLPGMGTWIVSAYSALLEEKLQRMPTSYSLLTEAQDAADALVCETFDHQCRTGECGRWLRWRE